MKTRMIILLIAAFLGAVAIQVNAEQPDPPVIFLQRDTPVPQTPPPPITPTVTPTATPTGVGPTMTVECTLDLECEAIVYPNTSAALLVLAVDAEYLDGWEQFAAGNAWGMRLWFDSPPCIGQVSQIRLLEGDEDGPSWPIVPSPVLATHIIETNCTFLPIVN